MLLGSELGWDLSLKLLPFQDSQSNCQIGMGWNGTIKETSYTHE